MNKVKMPKNLLKKQRINIYLIYMNVIIREAGGGADANSGICLYVSINNGSNFY